MYCYHNVVNKDENRNSGNDVSGIIASCSDCGQAHTTCTTVTISNIKGLTLILLFSVFSLSRLRSSSVKNKRIAFAAHVLFTHTLRIAVTRGVHPPQRQEATSPPTPKQRRRHSKVGMVKQMIEAPRRVPKAREWRRCKRQWSGVCI